MESRRADEIELIKKSMEDELNNKTLNRLSDIFQALADPTRLKIIYALSKCGMCVSELASAIDMTQSTVSHQLRLLRKLQLVKVERCGRNANYSLDDDHVIELFKSGLEHSKHG